MLYQKDNIEIPIEGVKENFILSIYPQTEKCLLFENDTPSTETKYQLMEGCTYYYEFISQTNQYQFSEENEIIHFHSAKAKHPCEGIITTGVYVGHLKLSICDILTKEIHAKVDLEIRSKKADYESDYRQMLNEISEYYTDLILQQGAPVSQQLDINESLSAQTLYQRFAFVHSIIDNDSFIEAIHKIISNPVKKWTEANTYSNIVSIKKFSRKSIQQIASAKNRISIPNGYEGFPHQLTSLPRSIEIEYKKYNPQNEALRFSRTKRSLL